MMGPEGWVYWTKGAFAEQNHELFRRSEHPVGDLSSSKAAHIYRRHPNGGPIDRLMSGGMDNPSDITFSPQGEIFFCSTFFHHPGNGLRDGIAHAPRGGLFGKPQSILDSHWKTGPLLQPITNLGSAAPASIEYLHSNSLTQALWNSFHGDSPLEAQGFLVSAQFNLQKIALHRLIPREASFETESRDLLSADRIDFHPVKTIVESEKSLIVFDTGGWYDLCCPSSGSDQSIARGGIYRLKLVNAVSSTDSLSDSFDSRSKNKVERAWEIAREITNASSEYSQSSKDQIIAMLSDLNPSVQQTAAKIVGVFRWKEASEPLEMLLSSDSPATVRVAIETLGIVGDAHSIRPILFALKRFPGDRYMEHSALYALLEIGAVDELKKIFAESQNEEADEVELYSTAFVLDQLNKYPAELLEKMVPLLASKSTRLRDISLKCLTSHSQGIALCLPFLENAWNRCDSDALNASLPVIKNGLENPNIRLFVAKCMEANLNENNPSQYEPKSRWLLACLRETVSKDLPAEWIEPLTTWINSASESSLRGIADTIRSIDFQKDDRDKISVSILARVQLAQQNPNTVLYLWASLPKQKKDLDEDHFQFILSQLKNKESSNRNLAIDILSKQSLSSESAEKLIESLDDIVPLNLQDVVDVCLKNSDSKLDAVLLNELLSLHGLRTLSIDRLLSNLKGRPDEVRKEWKDKLEAATSPPADIARNLDQWIEKLPIGDATHGYEVFRSAKAACSSCHQVGYIGGQTGPELSRIGKSRSRRDLVEAIVFPNIRIAQGFQPIRVLTTDGEVFNGLLKSQSDTHVELICGADKICRISKSEIEEQVESNISIMPSGLQDQISLQDLADLITYLESRH